MDIPALLRQLTLEEKAALVEGYQSWMTQPVPRLGIPSVFLTDGPHGVRKKRSGKGKGNMVLGFSEPATAFPTAVTMANSWSEENTEAMGRAIGEECRALGVQVLLGPGLNLKRNPLCGRNFEYYSEDPLLTGRLAGAMIRGVEASGVCATPKHFAMNHSENLRMTGSVWADRRAMEELYLKPFELAVRLGRPGAVMCAYNRVEGTFCSENDWLLRQVLRERWGFDGLIMTDWGAVNDRVKSLRAGCDLDMPGGVTYNRAAICRAVERGELAPEVLDASVTRVLKLVDRLAGSAPVPADFRAHHDLAVELACQGAVLLKNDGLLPLRSGQRIVVAGPLFETMRYQGAGSSLIAPWKLVTPKDAFDAAGVNYVYCRTEAELRAAAAGADAALAFVGLTDEAECEGFDRESLDMPPDHVRLVEALLATGLPTAAVLFGGSPMTLPFADRVSAMLHMFLPGQGGGEAVLRLLFGQRNPCGKLSETMMKELNGNTEDGKPEYRENIFVGYRAYDRMPERILYPFGHGLSYTAYAYSDLEVARNGETLEAACRVRNTGAVAGREIVQFYVRHENSVAFQPEKELRAFARVSLEPGEEKLVRVSIALQDLAFYHDKLGRFVLENGPYRLLAGRSSRDLVLEAPFAVTTGEVVEPPYDPAVDEAYRHWNGRPVPREIFLRTLEKPPVPEPPARPLTMDTRLADYRYRPMGRLLLAAVLGYYRLKYRAAQAGPKGPLREQKVKNAGFFLRLLPNNSARSLYQSSGGRLSRRGAQALVALADGHPLRALQTLRTPEDGAP